MSTQAEVAEKHGLIRDLLKKDKMMPPKKILAAVTKKFHSGVSRVDIARIRRDEFGVQLGPGGFAQNVNVIADSTPAAAVKAKETTHDEKFGQLVNAIRSEMATRNVSSMTIFPDSVEAVQAVKRTLSV